MTVVDVGANIGYYALMFRSFLGVNGQVICMEPDPTNLRELVATVSQNALDANITVLPIAASDRDGVSAFQPGLNSYISPDGVSKVAVVKVDSLTIKKIDFIKIDVEGYEGAVLDGAKKTIEQFRPTLFLELHPTLLTRHTHRDIVHQLQQHYRKVSVYQIERENVWQRFLQAYELTEQFTEATDLDELLTGYENNRLVQPCWILSEA
jgi:FkbM family methyltransferase